MNKRGSITKQWLYTFYIVLNVLVLVLFLTYINQLSSNKGITQEFISRDLGLTVDTLHNSPNPIKFSYVNPISYQLKIDKNSVSATEPNSIALGKYLYTKDNNVNIEVNLIPLTNSTLVFEKNKDISVSLNE